MTDQDKASLPAGTVGAPPTWRVRAHRVARILFERVSRSQQQKKIDHLTGLIQKVLANQKEHEAWRKQDQKWRMVFRRQLDAVIRNLYLTGSDVPAPHSLTGHRFRLRSQNEEDGVILALLKAAGVATRRFVEIGCGRSGGNAAILAYDFGWSGLMVDASPKAIDAIRKTFKPNPGVVAVRAKVTSDTLNDLLRSRGMTGEIDLLSIDVDSYDYWLLDVLTACSPRVLVMEYNALFGPDRAVTVPNEPRATDAPKGYSGASLAALEKRARQKGYRLVLCEEAGVNGFFLRNDLAPHLQGLTPAEAYRPWLDKWDLVDRPRNIDLYRVIEDRGLPLIEV